MACSAARKRRFGAFLVHGAAADNHFAEAGLIDQRGGEWRRSPLGGIGLLHVVHEIEADGARRAGIERGKNSGLAVGGNFRDLVESRVAEHLHG